MTHDTVKWALSDGKQGYEHSPVKIGDRCFIGTHSAILKGVTIGSCCVVGAGAVVTRDVPDNTIVAGVPARRIGRVVIDQEGVRLDYDKD
jgi:acetyltransferase-like isoleucine patch superfamily enzyme